jgi:S-adenosyl-L-methionine hydrolase (adenosine-forming)
MTDFGLHDIYVGVMKVHVVVVDPGVGSHRGAIALDLGDAHLVGPNNGVFSQVLAQYPVQSAISLDQSQYWTQPTPSATFHGRDIFAPVAAHLSFSLA